MNSIKITNDFIINGEKIKIISGAVHYFRIVPEYWYDTLKDLIDMGCNCVETYVPWNLHEPFHNEFDFSYLKDLEKFIQLTSDLGLFLIIRPSPYICAEWEFGGLPAWLLKENGIKLRTDDEKYLSYVDNYYSVLIPKIAKYQWTEGGPVILVQLENEYGSYRQNKNYLRKLHQMLVKYGIKVPIFTSDGSWHEALEAGSFTEEGVFPLANFGSNPEENIKELEHFKKQNELKTPIMCMEFWDGWFNKWGQEIIKRDPYDLASEAKEMLKLGSINFYMFQGGTNFGFMNGCSARGEIDYPQITSYDYDAILTESGQKTEKYHLLREIITKNSNVLSNRRTIKKYPSIKLNRKVSLFSTLSSISKKIESLNTLSFEELDHYYGYVLYEHKFFTSNENLRMRIVDARDRANIYLNDKFVKTQYQGEVGEEINLNPDKSNENNLKILIENMGRVNYGYKLEANTQKKGIKRGVMLDIHFTDMWNHYCLDFDKISDINWNGEYKEGPSFYEYILETENPAETYINLEGFGKGVVLVNGFNLGRFYNIGPSLSLYLPGSILNKGKNQIVIFETEFIYKDKLNFSNSPLYK